MHTWLLLLALAAAFLAGCKANVTVPDVKQSTLDQGRQTITAAGLTVGNVVSGGGAVLPAAKILAQSPAAGAGAAKGAAVDLTVDSPVQMPNLVGSGATDSLITLQNTGLKAALKKQSTIDVFRAGKVLAQDVTPQTQVVRDTVVTLTVATPPDVSALAPIIKQQPAYQRLSANQRSLIDTLLQ